MRVSSEVNPVDGNLAYTVRTLGLLTLLAAVQFLVLGWTLGYSVPMTAVTIGAVVWALMIMDYTVYRMRSIPGV